MVNGLKKLNKEIISESITKQIIRMSVIILLGIGSWLCLEVVTSHKIFATKERVINLENRVDEEISNLQDKIDKKVNKLQDKIDDKHEKVMDAIADMNKYLRDKVK